MAAEPLMDHWHTYASIVKPKGNVAVFISRAKAGFGGMITVSAVLLALQLITGTQAFPL